MGILPPGPVDAGGPRTNQLLGKDDPDWEIQASCGASTIAGDSILEVNGGELSIRESSHEERDAGPVEAAKLQRINQTESVFDPHCFDESPISVAESSRHSLALATALASRLPDLGDNPLAMVDISNFTILKFIDKKHQGRLESSTSASSSRYGLLGLWLPVAS
jgi:hypothetical protein